MKYTLQGRGGGGGGACVDRCQLWAKTVFRNCPQPKRTSSGKITPLPWGRRRAARMQACQDAEAGAEPQVRQCGRASPASQLLVDQLKLPW